MGNRSRVQQGYRPTELNPEGGAAEITAPATEAAKQWDGYGTALKPGHEPIVLARKPLDGTVAANVQKWGTGGLNIDGCRIGRDADDVSGWSKAPGTKSVGGILNVTDEKRDAKSDASGRWPANVLLDEDAAAELDAQSGERKAGTAVRGNLTVSHFGGESKPPENMGYGDPGGASRFFFVAKPDGSERDFGCDGATATGGEATGRKDGSDGLSSPRAGAGRRGGRKNIHPTVKPVELMQHLVRLVTPPGGLVLDPFTGSGSTGVACALERFRFLGIEQSAEYVALARGRIERAERAAPMTRSIDRAADMDPRQASLFDGVKT
jgi:site-specific DNA-methyltransferase (adenine-specific)